MAEVFIDNERYEFEGSGKLLQFMLDHGIEVPFFCYHPSMSIPANCRQCMVKVGTPIKNRETGEFELDEEGNRKIRWFPKMMTSCSMDLQDGMVVLTQRTDTEVRRAQKDNLEFILINHPLDCPICDQAGECPLQIQTYKYGPEGSRFEVEKAHKPKAVRLGPRVVLDAERCINCTRCVRFTEEISQTHQLTIKSRGDKNYPITAPGREFDDPYSLNTVDICPVGALTSADFRFRARVWEMSQTPSIDMSNGKGTNIDLWTRDNEILRITPRYNPHVNDYWMPDYARNYYEYFNNNRVSRPDIKLDEANQAKTSWTNTLESVVEVLDQNDPKEVLLIGSPFASVEENFTVQQFFTHLGAENPKFVPHIIPGSGDNFLISDDQAPNTNGVRLLDIEENDASNIKKALQSGFFKVVVILKDDLVGREVIDTADLQQPYVINLATNYSKTTQASDLIVPITTASEHAASYVNVDGRIQRTLPAKETRYSNRRLNLEMSTGRLDQYGTNFDNWVNDENKIDCVPAWEFISRLAERIGVDQRYDDGRSVMDQISRSITSFNEVSFERMDEEYGIPLEIPDVDLTKA